MEIFLYSPCWPQTHDPIASISQVIKSWLSPSTPKNYLDLENFLFQSFCANIVFRSEEMKAQTLENSGKLINL